MSVAEKEISFFFISPSTSSLIPLSTPFTTRAHEGKRGKVAFLSSFLFLSPTSSPRLMTLRSVTASAIDGFSTGILVSTHVPSPHLSVVNSVFPKISLLVKAHSSGLCVG
jgi:hypothetical protein